MLIGTEKRRASRTAGCNHSGAQRQAAAQALESACQAGESDARLDALLAATLDRLEPVLAGLSALERPESSASGAILGDQTGRTATAIDREALGALLTRMHSLLEDGDTEVGESLDSLEALLAETAFADAATRLRDAIEDYAFDDALTLVVELQAVLRPV